MRSSQLLASSSLSLPTDTYIYDVISISGKNTLATISSNDALRLIDESLQVLHNGAFDRVHDGVTCLATFECSVDCLVTAGRDAAVKVWDQRVGSQSLQLNGEQCSGTRKERSAEFPLGPHAPYLALASTGDKLAVGTELSSSQATVALWSVFLTES